MSDRYDSAGRFDAIRRRCRGEPTALTLRYQATFGTTARECRVAGASLTMRVGVEGRVILGPAGSPGTIEIPLRYAVVRGGTGAEDHHDQVAVGHCDRSAGRDQCAVHASRG